MIYGTTVSLLNSPTNVLNYFLSNEFEIEFEISKLIA